MKKLITLAISFVLLFSAVGCNNNNNNKGQDQGQTQGQPGSADKVADDTFFNTYTGLYQKSIGTLGAYNVYTDANTANDAFKDKEYPGNERYLKDVKAAYKDSRDKIESFVNGLKNDVKTDNTELKEMNEDLIEEGEELVRDIDKKIAKLDKITKDDYNKTQDEFIRLVHDAENTGDDIGQEFTDMLRNMDTRLGIDRNATNGNSGGNTGGNTNGNTNGATNNTTK